MKGFFSNKWTKRFFSLFSGLYAFLVCFLGYYAIFYNVHISSRVYILAMFTGVSAVALAIMLYTRRQLLTRISSFIILPAMLPVVLLYFGEWELIIPVIVTGVIILLLSGAGEGTKTAIGTIILLLYIFGALGYFLFTSFFVTSAKQTVVESGYSPSNMYRYRVVNTEDSSNGSTAIYVEPNYADVVYPFATFTLKNMERVVYLERPICEEINIEWTTETRQQVTEELNAISPDILVTLSDEEMEEFGHPYNERLQLTGIETEDKFALGLTASDVDPIPLETLTDEQLAIFNLARDENGDYYVKEPSQETLDAFHKDFGEKIYVREMNDSWLYEFYLEKNNTLPLSSFTDEQLANLGVSDEGDVMYFNGKVCFRFYVAEIEDYYDVNSRKLSLDLLS